MEINQGWIRNLFRYVSFSFYSLMVACYIIFSFFALIFWNGEIEEINNNTVSKLIVDNLWERNYWWNISLGEKRVYPSENGTFKDIDISKFKKKRLAKNTNQFLQNGNTLDSRKNFLDQAKLYGPAKENPFDIEKIIADLHLPQEKRVAVVAKQLGIDWENEKLEYANLAWIGWAYNWSLDHNMKIRDYLIYNAQEIYKEKHWWNEWDTLPLVAKAEENVKMNSKEITWQVTYNDVSLKVTAPVESFPEWTVLKIKTLGDDDSMTTFDITLKEVILMTHVDNVDLDAPMASFDISFYAPDDTEFLEELQPAEWKFVSVVFDYADNDEFKAPKDEWMLAVYHMEDNDYTSYANLVDVKDSAETKKTKSDSIGIYANALSVYILTVVSDLDDEGSQDNRTIMFNAGSGGFIVEDENIVLESTWTNSDIITWKIVSKDNTITLPDVKVPSWQRFGWWYRGNTLLWNAGSLFKLWNSNSSGMEESGLESEENSSFQFYACSYSEESTWDVCSFGEDLDSDLDDEWLDIEEESVNSEVQEIENDIYTPSSEDIQKYGQEMFDAYNWAIGNWITTIDDINKAKLNTKITRAELAKMMVVFMSWVLEKEPIITGSTVYKDVKEEKLWDLAWYIQLAYQYQIMWINADGTPMENFNPNKPVSRWEFATVLSRVLFGDTYNQNGSKYYEKHIEALNKANILSDKNPDLTEWRWWIIKMLYRTTL